MEKINVQILLTPEEYAEAQEKADQFGLTVPLYIRSLLFADDPYTSAYKTLIEKVAALPSGTRFNIRSLFGTAWTMSDGVKRNLGKTYNHKVKSGKITNVTEEGPDGSRVMWYRKK